MKPRQLKREKQRQLMQWKNPQPDPRPEPVQWKPLG